jgi:hypothetical protein
VAVVDRPSAQLFSYLADVDLLANQSGGDPCPLDLAQEYDPHQAILSEDQLTIGTLAFPDRGLVAVAFMLNQPH